LQSGEKYSMEVTLIDSMGTDLTVVNAARVSFSKTSTWARNIPQSETYELSDRDKKLIRYLAEHNHWSPFGHASLQFHIKAPVFVARQLVKHQVGLVWNEVSRRYVDDEPEFYIPKEWRLKAEDKKQGSSDETVEHSIDSTMMWCKETYQNLLNKNIAPEMARMVLPQNMMTEWYWSGTLFAFARVCNLRCKEDTQAETRVIANQISELAKKKFPVSWEHLTDGEIDE